jgi:hypothetical protein
MAPLAGAPAIGCVLVASWLFPLTPWAIAAVGAVSSAIYLLVVGAYRHLGRRLLAKPAVVAASVMYTIALFAVAYASLALVQVGSVTTNGAARPDSLGVAALLATAMGIAGGEVGAQVQQGARVIAHVQLLVVIGAVAGVGGQVIRRLADGDSEVTDPSPPPPRSLLLELYARIYGRLSEREGDRALDEQGIDDMDRRLEIKQRIRALPSPDIATDADALEVFERIRSRDLEYFYGLPLEGISLGDAVRPWLERHR